MICSNNLRSLQYLRNRTVQIDFQDKQVGDQGLLICSQFTCYVLVCSQLLICDYFFYCWVAVEYRHGRVQSCARFSSQQECLWVIRLRDGSGAGLLNFSEKSEMIKLQPLFCFLNVFQYRFTVVLKALFVVSSSSHSLW